MLLDDVIIRIGVEEVEVEIDGEADTELIVDSSTEVLVSVLPSSTLAEVTVEANEVELIVEEADLNFVIESAPDVIVLAAGGIGATGPEGPQGPAGSQGAQGPPGPAGPPSSSYIHTQSTLASTWVVVHNLGRFPSVTVVDTGNSAIIPDIHYDNNNQVTLTFGAPTSGKAYLN